MAVIADAVAAWLSGYIQAWESYDRDAIGALFSEDATYAYHPWDQPVRGREAIIASWLKAPDSPDSWTADYQPLAVEGDLAIVTGRTRYYHQDGSLSREFYNCFIVRFDQDGRCSSFTEWFMQKPGATESE